MQIIIKLQKCIQKIERECLDENVFLKADRALRGLPTLDAEKKAIFMNFFLEVYIIDIDTRIVSLSKYTLTIHK